MEKSEGFTLIELLVVVAIIAVLSAIVLFSVTQYINKARDASITGSLATLVTAGEVWYDNNSSSYEGFCLNASAAKNATDAISKAGSTLYCKDSENAWAACAQMFQDSSKAYCVDNTGTKKEINNSICDGTITICP
jgi:prepilin-type N-terminal cleavage/methylation domain-containing protein